MFKLFSLTLVIAYAYASAYTKSQKDMLLAEHNRIRRVTRAGNMKCLDGNCPAGNIPDLVWDDGLAKLAQQHSEKCVWKHSSGLRYEGKPVGENLWMTGSRANPINIQGMINGVGKGWSENEAKKMAKSNVNKFVWNGGAYGHFSQVVWGNTKKVGCAYHICNTNGLRGTVMTCNYSPAGNYIGAKIYVTGSVTTTKKTTTTKKVTTTTKKVTTTTKKPVCKDKRKKRFCTKRKKRGLCKRRKIKNLCKATCGACPKTSEFGPFGDLLQPNYLVPEPVDDFKQVPDDMLVPEPVDESQPIVYEPEAYPDNYFEPEPLPNDFLAPEEPVFMFKPNVPETNGINLTINMTKNQLLSMFTVILISLTLCFVSLFGYYMIKKGDCKNKGKYVKQVSFDSTDEEN